MTEHTRDDRGPVQWMMSALRSEVERRGSVSEALVAVDATLAGAKREALEAVLQEKGLRAAETCRPTIPCACGRTTLRLAGRQRGRSLDYSFGTVRYQRPYYAPPKRPGCSCPGRHPLDERLDLPRGALAETVVKALCLLAVLVPFDKATDVLFRLLGVAVSKKRAVTTVAKVSEQAYQQNRRRATQRWEHRQELIANRPPVGQRKGRLFVMVDGTNVGIKQSECFKECKSAVLFWEHDVRPRRRRSKSKRGRPDQHIERRLIVSHIGPHTEFLPYLWDAFVEMGGLSAEYVIWSADGIDWIWDDRQRVLPDDAFTVFELLDWYHLFENIWKAAKVLHDDPADQRRWVNAIKRTMRKRNTGCGLAADLRAIADAETDPEKQRVLSNVADYVYTHRHRMSYADFRYNNWPRGSAAIESVQHGVIQARFKLPGMRWTVDGANRMLRLRNAYFSGRWDEVFGNAFAALKHQLSPQADTPARKAG